MAKVTGTAPPGFKEWLYQTRPYGRGAGGPPDQRWQMYGTYSIANYILDENGVTLVDEVVKLEEINKQLPVVLDRIGLPHAMDLNIPHINARASGKYTEYYDDESRELVYERYKYDIDRFRYEFDVAG